MLPPHEPVARPLAAPRPWLHIRIMDDAPEPARSPGDKRTSLDGFDATEWLGVFRPGKHDRRLPVAAVLVGLLLGLVLGFLFFL
ncbi:MAG TPA: hypothetical protein VFS45_04795 [Sphingomicrobium sp.]|nr:hypothetical protein [Sphingomicrobium sp.]